jgi:hypothetical protein
MYSRELKCSCYPLLVTLQLLPYNQRSLLLPSYRLHIKFNKVLYKILFIIFSILNLNINLDYFYLLYTILILKTLLFYKKTFPYYINSNPQKKLY